MGSKLKIAIFQCNVIWENPDGNRSRIAAAVDAFMRGAGAGTELLVLPEFFTTGFTMDPQLAEAEGGETLSWMKGIAAQYDIALSGSIPVRDGGKVFNRHYFVQPDGCVARYDKRHLFRMSEENEVFAAGGNRVTVEFRGWRIALNTCYDLRFPAWSRNSDLGYDLMLNVASWPDVRIAAAQILARARAIENLCYFAFANRTGDSPSDYYSGGSMIVDFKGNDCGVAFEIPGLECGECFLTAELNRDRLQRFREKFPAWMDADILELK